MQFLPLLALLALLPLLGVALNGTSTVLYGRVPETAKGNDVGHVFAFFYTGVIGAGALADAAERPLALFGVGLTPLLTIPLAVSLGRLLAAAAPDEPTSQATLHA